MELKIKKLKENAVIPTKATPQSIGYDLYVPEDVVIEKERQVIPLGFALELPEGIEAKIEPRSGFSSKGIEGYRVKTDLCDILAVNLLAQTIKDGETEREKPLWQRIDKTERFNADALVGKIDPDYRGEVGVIIRNNEPDKSFLIPAGTRIAQMTFYPVAQFPNGFNVVDELSDTARSDGGFGSTGA